MHSESMEAPCPFSLLCPVHLFYRAGPELCPFIIIWQASKQSISLSSVSHTSIVIEPKAGVMGAKLTVSQKPK